MVLKSQHWYLNRPFPSSLVPLVQNESECETFLMKMSSACSFIFMQIKVSFALRLALKQRHKGTRKWPIKRLHIIYCKLLAHQSYRETVEYDFNSVFKFRQLLCHSAHYSIFCLFVTGCSVTYLSSCNCCWTLSGLTWRNSTGSVSRYPLS